MLAIQDAWNSTDLPNGCVATIGNYDGVHRGQQAILERVVRRGRELGFPSVVVTFEPHPLAVLRPREAPPLIATPEQKQAALAEAGVDTLLVLRFDRALSAVAAEAFTREFLARRLGVRELWVGSRFRFGRGREGDVGLLTRIGEQLGFAVCGVPEVLFAGEPISSTRIRRALLDGAVEDAAAMLGSPFELTGVVLRGDRMGQRLGWPTINVAVDNELVPRDGVYATRVELSGMPGSFAAATNIGTRPTVYENYQRVVESHILDFASDVYGQRVALRFHRRLREERIFATIMDLSAQIGRDVEATRELFLAGEREAGG
ncbi:MAG TPA: riboflavin biosynthesis protein RibF [Thermoanaerobaculia bacterium]|nr:riboflavin biosynthesis protein RibF [Thermoanaerobaculia bacterium]